ncbi:LacI family DNA-binding transcriptional regulator [Actinophytocola algeriensis]|uniref:DNA-binding LacI/PurR family transcriptional regulator n=1 Tax=Actinophytocola algeriensis TaxID=1768010 RepID=A0A7W7VIF8_9PSEU|nr:LacI family DNA-binding transcriptional regulator [Actinophytocola algeriensis]MBB4911517.1 DNA-binding LacI/PurR family transcriptional regulator [Actinophytocola algeriensis]MBE1473495.1 DNA-binding LacI/PurR family transcriptional regulator [Actinophytocola algeriensis]
MADVAREAGVSGQTVSRVVNGRLNVDQATRQRVLDAMRTVGYRPNSAARALRYGQFRSIGVIMGVVSTFGNSRTLDAITSAAVAKGYSITLMPVTRPTPGEVMGAFSRLDEQAVDGVVILIEEHELDQSEVEVPDGLPVVVISNPRSGYPMVDTDQAQGAELATTHLLELGHRTVWHLSGPPHSYAAERREQSWRATLRRHDRQAPPVVVGDWSAESGYVQGMKLCADAAVTAVFAANDQMALGLLRALHELARLVPAEVSVVGFDDMAEAAHFWPPLTTVRQSFAEVGRRAVDALLAEIESGERHVVSVKLPTTLVHRSSTAPPP